MKRIFVIICLLLLISGCDKKEEPKNEIEDSFVLSKIYKDKDYVYSDNITNYTLLNGDAIELKDIIINLNSEDVSNVNLELRSFVRKANKSNVISNNQLINGCIYNYDYYINDLYLSLIVNYKYLSNNIYGDEESMVYVISLSNGKIVSNKDLLDNYNLSESEMFNLVEKSIESEDNLYTLKNIKDNGYSLYVKDNYLVVLFYEINDDETIKKELILN